MKWITLKMNMIPIIFQEIDNVTETYISILNNIRKANTSEEQTKEQIQQKEEFNELRESVIIHLTNYIHIQLQITSRINELEQFYDDNIEDIRVTYFEKARLRLKRLLMYDIDTINRIENSSNPNNIITTTTYNQTVSPYKKEYKPKMNNIDKQKKNDTALIAANNSQHNSSKKNKRQVYMKPLTKAKKYKATQYDDNKKQINSSYMYTDNHLE